MKLALALLLLALAVAPALLGSPAYAHIELTEADPPDSAHRDAPADVVHLCFSQPVIIEDVTAFGFDYLMPDGRSLGLRIVFRPDGRCVGVFPGLPEDRPAGEYIFEWQVSAAEGDEEGSGTLHFQVSAGRTPAPSPSPTPQETPASLTPSPEAGGGAVDAGDDGPDIPFLALITTAAAGGAAVLFTLAHLLRKRIGYEPHRPPEGGEEGEGH